MHERLKKKSALHRSTTDKFIMFWSILLPTYSAGNGIRLLRYGVGSW